MLRSLMIQDLLADVSLGRHGIASAAAQYLKYRQRVPESHDGAAGLEIEALIRSAVKSRLSTMAEGNEA